MGPGPPQQTLRHARIRKFSLYIFYSPLFVIAFSVLVLSSIPLQDPTLGPSSLILGGSETPYTQPSNDSVALIRWQ